MPEKQAKKLTVLVILDGWGIAPPSQGNAITLAKTPFFNKLTASCPTFTLQASGEAVGLPWGVMGNSEVGHLNIGSGKIIYQNLPRINRLIISGEFFKNEVILKAIKHAKKNNSNLHLMGLVSRGNVHSSLDHLYALIDCASQQNFERVFIHAFLDGRDTPKDSAKIFIAELEEKLKFYKRGKIATISGRYYAMDRDNHWERIEKVYRMMTEGKGQSSKNTLGTIKTSYQNNIFDEEFGLTVITDKNGLPLATVQENDALIYFNYRPDRARELTRAFVSDDFSGFNRGSKIKNLFFATMTEYEDGLPVEIISPTELITTPLAKVISENNLAQLHVAETEKYAHITYFLNGGSEKSFSGEDWVLVPSPRIASYDEKPEMSAPIVAQKVIEAISSNKYDFIAINFANPDMVGHTGNLSATVKATEIIDKLLGEIILAALEKNGNIIITADHGNAEELVNLRNGEIDKEHSTNPVPLIIVGHDYEITRANDYVSSDLSLVPSIGVLADIAPTILKIMGIKQPPEMTGTPLI
ncbi:MAG: 2,3-bisphosphoglycerate-independent phosphoglycerate mutase [Patescibacteria group bacterium]